MAEQWTLGKLDDDVQPDTYVIGDKGLLWCKIVGSPGRPAEPRARLMWAAQDLLDALNDLSRGYSDGPCFCEMSIDNPMYSSHSNRCLRARAAIAKATGQGA